MLGKLVQFLADVGWKTFFSVGALLTDVSYRGSLCLFLKPEMIFDLGYETFKSYAWDGSISYQNLL